MLLLLRKISIHAPREGSDRRGPKLQKDPTDFYPRSPRGERPGAQLFDAKSFVISIHAPREGSDQRDQPLQPGQPAISIHAPREGSDPTSCGTIPRTTTDFYPRSPRGERHLFPSNSLILKGISIHAPREGSDGVQHGLAFAGRISIHAPREGSDRASSMAWPLLAEFLSTLPARGATAYPPLRLGYRHNFYPRSPRGERPKTTAPKLLFPKFLSTLPARGATQRETCCLY